MKTFEIQRIYIDNETCGLKVVYFKRIQHRMEARWEPHAIAEQLHICKDGSSRRETEDGSCWGFVDDDSKANLDVEFNSDSFDLVHDEEASREEPDFEGIMEEAWDLLEENGVLDEDGCIPAENDYLLYESEYVYRDDWESDGDRSYNKLDWEEIVPYMNDDLREELHNELAPCTQQHFYDVYCKRHEEKFGEEFVIN